METKVVEFTVEPEKGKIIKCLYFFSDESNYPGDKQRMEELGLIDFFIRIEEDESYPGKSRFQQRVKREMMNVNSNELLSIAIREALGFLDPEKYPFYPHKYWP